MPEGQKRLSMFGMSWGMDKESIREGRWWAIVNPRKLVETGEALIW